MLDLRRMMLLCDLAELGTVTAVADRRGITSSAVSQQLRVLEDEVGATLFRRVGRSLGLTRGGVVLADHARRVLGAVDEAMTAVAATQDRNSGQLVVASFNMGISLLAAPMVARLGIDAPDIHVQLRQEDRGPALRLLRQGEIDLAITCTYGFGAHESLGGLRNIALVSEPLVLMAPARLHLPIHDSGIAALADASWVTGPENSGLGVAVLRAGERADFIPRIKHRLIGARNICDLAATGVGPAIVPRLSVPEHLRSLVVDDVELESREISAVVRAGRRQDPNTSAALDILRSIADEIVHAHTAAPIGVAS
ncbi:LysR family transcriptional regulator [Gordonia sp. CPCC 206044]|uniref:LysR family transcriptional regulator n=1 Tax=Gordonia sp. CPCC 206044 TaxID=3140793 RepID=UPI003AF35783